MIQAFVESDDTYHSIFKVEWSNNGIQMYQLISKSPHLKDLTFETEFGQLNYVKRPIPLSSILHQDLIYACVMI